MKSIVGNNFLISIAYNAASPSQAADMAQAAGYSQSQIRNVRNAAKIKRDKGIEEFNRVYSPYELVDTSILTYTRMNVNLKINRIYEKRGLNAKEFNEVAEKIEKLLRENGIETQIKKVNSPLYVKSTLASNHS